MDAMISFQGVTKQYGDRTVLDDLSFEVGRGEFFGYLGPNGAGKTTSIKTMIGLVRPNGGIIKVNGVNVADDPVAVRAIIGYVPDSPFIYDKLSGVEFLRFVGGLYRMEREDMEKRIAWLCDIFEMHGWIDRRTEGYSHGMKQKVVMSAAFLHRPDLIIVDEPTVGLDPPSARLLKDMLSLIREHGTTIFMSSHDLAVIEELCTRMAIIHRGTIVAQGTIEDLQSQAEMTDGTLEGMFMKLTDNVTRPVYLD